MFLPVSIEEVKKLGWKSIDIILVTGDAYIDSPYSGTAVIGKYLLKHGFKVAVISQPDMESDKDITLFGEPALFWGVNSGCVDSMVANYTSLGKPRKQCDFTPGGVNNRRPDRAVIAYTGLIRRYFKNTKPIVIGGIEASLRRIAHYDFKTDKVRRSILFDSKADYLIYGMGEVPVLEFAKKIKDNEDVRDIRGLCYISKESLSDSLELPSYEEVCADKKAFHKMFKIFSDNSEAQSGKRLFQKTADRYLIQNPPAFYTDEILDEVSYIHFEREVHPLIKGTVKAQETIKYSIMSHRGCFGGCSFCAIAVHQGRRVVSRSIDSILKEVDDIVKMKNFKGTITDIGGPTGNMYGMKCKKMEKFGACTHKSCLHPKVCKSMDINHKYLLDLFKVVEKNPHIKKLFTASGIRADLAVNDKENGDNYIKRIAERHVSGQLKMAPESADVKVLNAMKKPDNDDFLNFCSTYKKYSRLAGRNQYISCYFISAHPGESRREALNTSKFIQQYLDFSPEQVQIFTPTPSTWSTCAYYTGLDEEGNEIYVEKKSSLKEEYKQIIMGRHKRENNINNNKSSNKTGKKTNHNKSKKYK